MTRPTALRPEQCQPLIDALHAGATYRDAVGSVGLSWQTWCSWTRAIRKGEPVDPRVADLVAKARNAYHKATTSITAQVRVAAAKDWRAAAFLLDHRRGDPKARHDQRRAKWEAEIAENRAKGLHVEKAQISTQVVLMPALEHDASAVSRPTSTADATGALAPEPGSAIALPRLDSE